MTTFWNLVNYLSSYYNSLKTKIKTHMNFTLLCCVLFTAFSRSKRLHCFSPLHSRKAPNQLNFSPNMWVCLF